MDGTEDLSKMFVDEEDENEDGDQKRLTKVESDNELVLFLILQNFKTK